MERSDLSFSPIAPMKLYGIRLSVKGLRQVFDWVTERVLQESADDIETITDQDVASRLAQIT